ncbi:hypothetical protein E2C01_046012 [Portunus trituberculatus]|uniref:Uncharacterized protein n=1 Tax=Portunus trituberculatus TaxID=210409 RepID=A0A5B7FWN0_PORTR|nr:hypothetical protein [Portunus trituberculatus]
MIPKKSQSELIQIFDKKLLFGMFAPKDFSEFHPCLAICIHD